MELKDKIHYLRKLNNLTLEQLGNEVGVGKSTVRKWETGDIKNMRRDKIEKLATALHTTPADLMGWNSDDPSISQDLLECLPLIRCLKSYCERFNSDEFSFFVHYYQDSSHLSSLKNLLYYGTPTLNDRITFGNQLGVSFDEVIQSVNDSPDAYLPLTLTRAEIRTILAIRSQSVPGDED